MENNFFLLNDAFCSQKEFSHLYSSKMIVDESLTGQVSADRSAIIGKNGWCFIYEGSNNYKTPYTNTEQAHLGDAWGELILHRSAHFKRKSMQFLQIIIPNKLSIINEFFPEPLPHNQSSFMNRLITTYNIPNLLIPLTHWRINFLKGEVFRRSDSHLSIIGNIMLLCQILDELKLGVPPQAGVAVRVSHQTGDLGSKFTPALKEEMFIPEFRQGILSGIEHFNVVNESIKTGSSGVRQVFINKEAPFKKKIVVFGNSFFDRVPSWGLSPFFCALFQEFHFLWKSNIDTQYCEKIGADIVIGQTCERFMTQVPNDIYS